MGDKVHAAIHSESAAEGPPNNLYNFSVGDQMWQGGPTKAPYIVRPDQLRQPKVPRMVRGIACGSHNWSGGTNYGRTGCRMSHRTQEFLQSLGECTN